MAFAEVERTSMQSGQYGAAAVFTTAKSGAGTLRINVKSMEHLRRKGKNWSVGDMVRIFHDPETRRLALIKNPEGKFRLAKNVSGSNSLRVCSKDLRELIKEPTEYEMEESGEYDLVLRPKK